MDLKGSRTIYLWIPFCLKRKGVKIDGTSQIQRLLKNFFVVSALNTHRTILNATLVFRLFSRFIQFVSNLLWSFLFFFANPLIFGIDVIWITQFPSIRQQKINEKTVEINSLLVRSNCANLAVFFSNLIWWNVIQRTLLENFCRLGKQISG